MGEFASKGVAGAALGTGIGGLALGVLNPYTQVFGRRDLECPYLITPVHGKRHG